MAKRPARKLDLACKRAHRRGVQNAQRRAKRQRVRAGWARLLRRSSKSRHPLTNRLTKSIDCPEEMNLSDGYTSTVSVIQEIRSLAKAASRSSFYINFRQIRKITPAAALLLAAALDGWNRLNPHRRLRAVDVPQWDPGVRSLLQQMGFFDLLRVNRKDIGCDLGVDDEDQLRFLQFYAGEGSGGDKATLLRDKIEQFAGPIKGRYALYDGLVEAMTNVTHHAYPGGNGIRRWWISGSIERSTGRLTVLCLDHGVGIPKTLPRTSGEEIRRIFGKLRLAASDDARMIEAATKLSRSSTGRRNRGYGLQRDIRRYVQTHDSHGRLRILSNRGMYVFEKDRDGVETSGLRNHDLSISGTFIEWTIEDYARELL